jgi:hypothetical protein
MNLAAPQIGFDRFIQLDWATAALRVRAGLSDPDQLGTLLDAAHAGAAAKKKTRTVLNWLWLDPRPELVEFADRAVQIYRDAPDTPVAALSWGMALTTYPFFGKVSALTVAAMDTNPILYPFDLGPSLGYILSNYCTLELRTDSMSNQVVNLKVHA